MAMAETGIIMVTSSTLAGPDRATTRKKMI